MAGQAASSRNGRDKGAEANSSGQVHQRSLFGRAAYERARKANGSAIQLVSSQTVGVLAIFILLCGGLAACGSDGSSGATPPKPAKTLTAISIDPINPSIAAGTTVQLSATGVFSDGTTEELTDSVTWASADVTIAEVGNAAGAQGLLIGKSLGITTVTATLGQVQGSSALTVSCHRQFLGWNHTGSNRISNLGFDYHDRRAGQRFQR
jgi:uncharacterized protein YjdB